MAEWKLRDSFRFLAAVMTGAIVLLVHWGVIVDSVQPLGPDRAAAVRFVPVQLPAATPSLRLLGAWAVAVDDPRFGGESALVFEQGRLLALSDFAVLTTLPLPGAGAVASVHSLPQVNGDPRFKANRDSEALVRDRSGRGWWVAYEHRHAIARYDERLERLRAITRLARTRWSVNRGIESLLAEPNGVTAIAENGREVVTLSGDRVRREPLTGTEGNLVSDATRLADGRTILILRRLTATGFRNALAWLERGPGGWTARRFAALPARGIDNFEGIASEPLADGATRLWLITDNDAFRWRRTLLIALLLPPPERPRR